MKNTLVLLATLVCHVCSMQAQANFWRQTNGPSGQTVVSLASSSNGYTFAGTFHGIYRSSDHGNNWYQKGLSFTAVAAIAVNQADVVFVGTTNDVLRSTDYGETWTPAYTSCSTIYSFVFDPADNLLAGTGCRIYRTTNGGNTWTGLNTSPANASALAVDRANQDIFAGTLSGVFRSTDNGQSWFQMNEGLTDTMITSVMFGASGDIFASSWAAGVFRSTDNGSHWTRSNVGLSNLHIRSFAVDSIGSMFAGTEGGGIYRSVDNGASWRQVNTGLTNYSVRSLLIDASGYILAGTAGAGVFISVQPTFVPDIPDLVSPSNGATNQQSTLTLRWRRSFVASSYRVQVSADSAFVTGIVIDDSTIVDTLRNLSLEMNTRYFWRVSARTSRGVSSWSNTWNFTTLGLPSQVTLVSPQEGLTINTDSARFVWRRSQFGVTRYCIELSSDSLFVGGEKDSTIIDTTRTVYALPDNTTLWWRIRAWNPAGWGPVSVARRFSTNIPPTRPRSLVADGLSESVRLSWEPCPDSDVMRYYVYSGTTPGNTILSDSTVGPGDSSKTIFNLTNGQRYYFRVAAVDSSRNLSALSLQVSTVPAIFTIPATVQIDSLKNGSIAWGDYDGDGLFDVILTGEKDTSRFSKVYRSSGPGRFEEINAMIIGVRYGRVDWCDYNNDNLLDILFIGDHMPLTYPGTARIYRNLGSNNFVNIGAPFTAVAAASIEYGDYNNDGRMDVIVAGWNGSSGVTKLFRQDANGGFVPTNVVLPPMQNPSMSWADYDNDGDLDLLMVGGNGGPYFSKLFRNDGSAADTGWIFTDINAPFVGVNGGTSTSSWGDFDSDGDLDLAIVGWDPVAHLRSSKIYRNNGDGSFVDVNAALTPLSSGSVSWGDYDGDGLLDLAFIGFPGTGTLSTIYRNQGGGAFSQVTTGLQAAWSTALWGDYDNDNDLDLIAGRLTNAGDAVPMVYRNNGVVRNTRPTTPLGLQSIVTGNSVRLRWQRSYDQETPANGLSYNISVGTTRTGSEAMSPMANLSTGARRVARLGNVDEDTTWVLRNLAQGRYYWTLQAVDNSFAGSPFAPVDSFVIVQTGVSQMPNAIATDFFLAQNYPNPWNPSTIIKYGLPTRTFVRLTVFNTLGQLVASLADEIQEAGIHEQEFRGDNLASGVYFCRLEAGGFLAVRRLVFLK